ASGLCVRLCRPPVFASLAIGRRGTELQTKVTDISPESIKVEDIEAFTNWLSETLARLFVEPRFSATPNKNELGLADILIDDLKFIFRWLRGEVFSAGDSGLGIRDSEQCAISQSPVPSPDAVEDLGRFPRRQGAVDVPGGSGEAELLSS